MLKNFQAELQALGKYVVQQSRTNLTKGKHNVSRDLYNSIKFEENSNQGIDSIKWIMDNYGEYVDQGVHGTKSSYVTAKNSPFKYKESSSLMGVEYYSGKNKQFGGIFGQWAKSKNIRLRDDKGKFKKGNYKSIGYVLARSIKEKGIKPTFFFTKAFDNAFKRFPPLLLEAMKKDLIEELKQINNG
jgi:hypothetical protein|tara:strand:- start:31 stop:588 length:558 start_codon:yes stop_codon:yes gene_type:complete